MVMFGFRPIGGQHSRRASQAPTLSTTPIDEVVANTVAYSIYMAKSHPVKIGKLRVLSSRTVFRGPVFQVTRDEVQEPSGIRAKRDIVRHPGSVVVLAIDDSQQEPRVLLERQFRYAARQNLWELPAGRIDEGESELAAAKRELIEETGYTAAQWKKLVKYYASPGFIDETMSIYLARDLHRGTAQPEDDEVIRTRLFSLSDTLQMIARGKIFDGKTIIGVLWFQQQHSSPTRRRRK
jgi:ADP-ribose pyrophosphatase